MTRNIILLVALICCLLLVSGCGEDDPTSTEPIVYHDSSLIGSWLRTFQGSDGSSSPSTDSTVLTFNGNGTGTTIDNSNISEAIIWFTDKSSTILTISDPTDYTNVYNYEITDTTMILSWSDEGHNLEDTYAKQ